MTIDDVIDVKLNEVVTKGKTKDNQRAAAGFNGLKDFLGFKSDMGELLVSNFPSYFEMPRLSELVDELWNYANSGFPISKPKSAESVAYALKVINSYGFETPKIDHFEKVHGTYLRPRTKAIGRSAKVGRIDFSDYKVPKAESRMRTALFFIARELGIKPIDFNLGDLENYINQHADMQEPFKFFGVESYEVLRSAVSKMGVALPKPVKGRLNGYFLEPKFENKPLLETQISRLPFEEYDERGFRIRTSLLGIANSLGLSYDAKLSELQTKLYSEAVQNNTLDPFLPYVALYSSAVDILGAKGINLPHVKKTHKGLELKL